MKVLSFFRDRPIAVSMAFLALVLLGTVASLHIPVSLLPDIPAGKIIVKTEAHGYSPRKLEDEVAQHIRHQLMQITKIDDIKSKTFDGFSVIELFFPFDTDMEMALVEVNEQVDKVLPRLPSEIERPNIVQIGANDIPVFYLNIVAKKESKITPSELNIFAEDVIRRRLEQLKGVAFIDISGLTEDEIAIIPDTNKLRILGIGFEDIKSSLQESTFKTTTVNLTRNDFEYSLVFPAIIKSVEDIRQTGIKKGGREKTIPLGDICKVVKRPKHANGYCLINGQPTVSMAVIRQDRARLDNLKKEISEVIVDIKASNPHLELEIVNDQSELLSITISNLFTTLITGVLLVICVVFIFIRNRKLPLLIGLSIPISLSISIMFFYLLKISINIISLSGLILGIGMMIDNAIIVVDNINRKYYKTKKLLLAVVEGGGEVFSPLLSSVLTTISIFIPLIFLSGISGALFYDQAVAVAVGLFVSLGVSIILVPVYYKLLNPGLSGKSTRINTWFEKLYEYGFKKIDKNQKKIAVLCVLLIVGSVLSLNFIERKKIPYITRLNSMVSIDWNQPITAKENLKRTIDLGKHIEKYTVQQMAWVGQQQYFLQHLKEQNTRETGYYLSFNTINNKEKAYLLIGKWMEQNYPDAVFEYKIAPNLLDYIFLDDEPKLALRFYYDEPELAGPDRFHSTLLSLDSLSYPEKGVTIPLQEQLRFVIDPIKLSLMNIEYESLISELQAVLQPSRITSISEGIRVRDIVFQYPNDHRRNWTDRLMVNSSEKGTIPLSKLGTEEKTADWSVIYSDRQGKYLPYELSSIGNPRTVIDKAEELIKNNHGWRLGVAGSFLDKDKFVKEMVLVMLVSFILLYLILAAQFESLSQPIIILLEIPIDIMGAVFMLYLFNSSLNILSMIGIIVVTGIVINDSILKIDTVNRLIKKGLSVPDAVHKAGQIRLRPIIMTTLTTIFALVPFLFGTGLGNEIQKPLALTVIGGLGVGTIVSLLFLPFFYIWLYRLTSTIKRRTIK